MSRENPTTYSFLDLSGAIMHPIIGPFVFTGEGVGEVNIAMTTEKTGHDVAADGSVMVSYLAGDNGNVSIKCQQTSLVHKWLLAAFNASKIAAEAGAVSKWAGMKMALRNASDGTSHAVSGMSFQKIPDKPYQAQGQYVTWTLPAANIQSVPA